MQEENLGRYLNPRGAPDPDLLIRTGGECRISNFMLWQSAHSELDFTETFWPDFGVDALVQAFTWYAQSNRRFGGTNGSDLNMELAAN